MGQYAMQMPVMNFAMFPPLPSTFLRSRSGRSHPLWLHVLDTGVHEGAQDLGGLFGEVGVGEDGAELHQVDEGDHHAHGFRRLGGRVLRQGIPGSSFAWSAHLAEQQRVAGALGQVAPHTGERPCNLRESKARCAQGEKLKLPLPT